METRKCLLAQVVFSLFVTLLSCSLVQAETINCTPIPSLPWTITTQGIHCLTSDLATSMTSGHAIEIATNNVVIDLNGHKIGGLGAGPDTTAFGIYAYQRQNITIRNGTVRGFQKGIVLDDPGPYWLSQGHLIEDIRADMNTYRAIDVYGRGIIIRNNQVVSTVGGVAYGISAAGPGNRILNNDVCETKSTQAYYAFGINVEDGPDIVIANNRVGNETNEGALSYGIFVQTSGVLIKDNTISMWGHGIHFNSPSLTGLYMNNMAIGCTTPFLGGTPAGSTNYSVP